MKIAVYTPALNEVSFVSQWCASTIAADYRLVLDTGSTDGTVDALQSAGVVVGQAFIRPWRFDDARNAALHLLPDDIDVCVALDMDEVLTDGWREHVSAVWAVDTTRLKYRYKWSSEVGFFADEIHGRHTHRWRGATHESLYATRTEVFAWCQVACLIEHHPNWDKPRPDDIPLLELALQENPADARASHYYARELYYRGRWKEAIAAFERHIGMATADWPAEKAASWRYGARCWERMGEVEHAQAWYVQATVADPTCRESLIELAIWMLRRGEWHGVIHYAMRAVTVPAQETYIGTRYAREEGPYDLAAVAYWNLGMREQARICAEKAVALNPVDDRLRDNLAWCL